MNTLESLLVLHEGEKLKAYKCTAGKTTVGVGRNLDDLGLTKEESRYLLANDIKRVTAELTAALPWFTKLDPVRQTVLLDMCFNLGINGLLKFKNTLAFFQAGNYAQAAENMLLSLWAKQVGPRAKRLADMVRTGNWPTK